MGDTLVVIRCMVYNHKDYLRACLGGFAMQKTDFKFVAIVHDDCSTDGSIEILKEYAAKYPEIIHPIYEKENQYSKHDGSTIRIMNAAIDAVEAKYMVMCEGDDYWTDPYKLQKQVDYMEAHPECAVCFHPVMVHDQRTGEDHPDALAQVPILTTSKDLARIGNYIHTPSVMYRYNKEVNKKLEQLGRIGIGDYLQHLLYAQYGNICKLQDYMAVYRQGVGVWTGPKSDGERNQFNWIVAVAKVSSLIDDPEVKQALDNQIYEMADSIIDYIEKTDARLEQIQKSNAYRLGKVLLKPLRWLKRI